MSSRSGGSDVARAKRIGILGGISAESTSEYYERITRGYYRREGDYYFPEIAIFSLDFQRFTDFENADDLDGYVDYIMSGVRALERAGVDFLLMAANSPHSVFERVEVLAEVPMLSIVRVTAEEAKREGLRKLLLLGIEYTMKRPFYRRGCEEYGISVVVPSEGEQHQIDRIIFEELARGVRSRESKAWLLELVGRYEVDGVILGCTELPLLLVQDDADVRLLDTVEIHTRAALDAALGVDGKRVRSDGRTGVVGSIVKDRGGQDEDS